MPRMRSLIFNNLLNSKLKLIFNFVIADHKYNMIKTVTF